ncbi:MAG TPA: glycoside hydrolase family 2 TIM barrel-domain containing protein, partial [Verrucomicrobiota bacterium]|nr:glycoside hydrolase family 2 TIM barrel-domain containing protein [Verrucomicrobiota bacterium]
MPNLPRPLAVLACLTGMMAFAPAWAATNEIQFLSGTDKDHTVPWGFRVSAGRNSGFWTNIPVPSCWDTKGFGSYEYGNDSTSEVGEYRHHFTVPDRWTNQRVFLVFEGVMTDTEVKLNGQSPGEIHQGGFYEFCYEVTSNLVSGVANNLLEVTVRKKSANLSINQAERQADYWTFGGIYRPVYLEARPKEFIERIATDAKADGQITLHAFFSGLTKNYTVAAQVTDANGAPLGQEFTTTIAAGASNAVLAATLPAPQPWSPEFPHLYKLTIQLRDEANLIHSLAETIGFRTITFTNSVGFFLNGKKILLRGVNRHEFWPTSGRTTSRALSISDIETIKSMNMNAVRMSHYPPAKHFLEECDRHGLLVIDELGGWQAPPYDNQIAPGLVREMVVRDVNHPCIFAWANGNEGGSNPTVDDDFALWDPQNRKVLHPANWESELTGGVRTHHYATYRQVTNYLGAGKPVYMPTEIQHALYDGGGGAGLEDHWNAMQVAPNSGGMFIWALLDEGLVRDDRGGMIDVAGDNAPDGILGPYREKEASYYTVKALWSPVQITPPEAATFDGTLAIENRFDFTDLSQCTFHWQLGSFPDPGAGAGTDFVATVNGRKFAGPAIAPGASGRLGLDLPANWADYDALRLTAEDPHGREIYTWTWPLRGAAQVRDRIVGGQAELARRLMIGIAGGELSVTNGPRVWRFDLASGRLNGVSVAGQTVALANGPRPVTGLWSTNSVTHGFNGADYVVTMNNVTNASDGFQWC